MSQHCRFDLYFYNVRWYDPSLGRFAQVDTIVPGGVLALNRYASYGHSAAVSQRPTATKARAGARA